MSFVVLYGSAKLVKEGILFLIFHLTLNGI